MASLSAEDVAIALKIERASNECVAVLKRHFEHDIPSALTVVLDLQAAFGSTMVTIGMYSSVEEFIQESNDALRSMLDHLTRPKG